MSIRPRITPGTLLLVTVALFGLAGQGVALMETVRQIRHLLIP